MTENDVHKMMSHLTTEQLEMVNAVWRINESFWPDLSSASIKRYGVSPEKLDATPFEVNGVVMTGGHMRLFYKSLRNKISEEQRSGEQYASMAPTASSLIERAGSGGAPVVLDRTNIARALEESIHFIAFAENGMRVRRIINAKDVQEALVRKHGEPFTVALIEQLDQLIRNAAAKQDGWSSLFRLLRRAATYRHLMFSVRNIVQQTSALPTAMAEVGPVAWNQAAFQTLFDGGATYKLIVAKSPFMRDRTSLVNRETAEYLNRLTVDSKVGHVVEAMKRGGFAPQTAIDRAIAIPTWWARYEQSLNKHNDEGLAISQADAAVHEAVGSGSDLHLGGAFNSNTGEFLRTATMFGSFFNATYNRMYRESHGFTKPLSVGALNAMFTVPMISAVLAAALIYDIPEDKEPEDWVAWAFTRYASFVGATLPIIRDVVALGTSGFTPKTVLAGAQEGPIRAFQEATAFIEGDQSKLKTFSDLLKVVSTFYPILGAGQITRVADYWDSYDQGSEGDLSIPQMLVEGPNRNKVSN